MPADESLRGARVCASVRRLDYTPQVSYKFDCISNPTAQTITMTVYSAGATSCSSASLPEFQIPVYEGCNEDFPYLMDLQCVLCHSHACTRTRLPQFAGHRVGWRYGLESSRWRVMVLLL